jgi:hypothetical protein
MATHLELLIGEKIINIDTGFSSVYPLNNDTKDFSSSSMLVSTEIYFEHYTLSIFNNHELISADNHPILDIIGKKVASVQESDSEVQLRLTNNDIIKVNLSDEAYNDPEAMCLQGPDNLIVVWNK